MDAFSIEGTFNMISRVRITTDLQIENYIFCKKRVEVWIGEDMVYYGRIFSFTSESITVRDGNLYLRECCSIKSRYTYLEVVGN